jgi:hypothetical protein
MQATPSKSQSDILCNIRAYYRADLLPRLAWTVSSKSPPHSPICGRSFVTTQGHNEEQHIHGARNHRRSSIEVP